MHWTQIVFGAVLVAFIGGAAGVFGWLQVRALRRLKGSTLPEEEQRFERTQARRRLWGCGLLALIASLLALQLLLWETPAQAMADQEFAKKDAPGFTEEQKAFLRLWGGAWVALGAALVALLFLAALDRYSTRTHALKQLKRLQADRRAMVARQAARMRESR